MKRCFIPDYTEPTIRALDELFDGVNIDDLPPYTQFTYYRYYGSCLADRNPQKAVDYLRQARKIARSNSEVGVTNIQYLDGLNILANLCTNIGTNESKAAGVLFHNEVISIGISWFRETEIGGIVISSLIEQAKAGTSFWNDAEWVEKLWMRARDLALELNDATYYSLYVIGVMNYYCDLEEYDKALSFLNDAINKEILLIDAKAFNQLILDVKKHISLREQLKSTYGISSIEHWKNELEIATFSYAICSDQVAFKRLQEVEEGLRDNNLTNTYEYSQVIYLLSDFNDIDARIVEKYQLTQIEILNTTPHLFIYAPDFHAYNSLGATQLKLGRYIEAEANFRRAIDRLTLDPKVAELPGYKEVEEIIYHNLGRTLYFLKDYNSSKDYLEKSITIQKSITGSPSLKSEVYLLETMEQIKKASVL